MRCDLSLVWALVWTLQVFMSILCVLSPSSLGKPLTGCLSSALWELLFSCNRHLSQLFVWSLSLGGAATYLCCCILSSLEINSLGISAARPNVRPSCRCLKRGCFSPLCLSLSLSLSLFLFLSLSFSLLLLLLLPEPTFFFFSSTGPF